MWLGVASHWLGVCERRGSALVWAAVVRPPTQTERRHPHDSTLSLCVSQVTPHVLRFKRTWLTVKGEDFIVNDGTHG